MPRLARLPDTFPLSCHSEDPSRHVIVRSEATNLSRSFMGTIPFPSGSNPILHVIAKSRLIKMHRLGTVVPQKRGRKSKPGQMPRNRGNSFIERLPVRGGELATPAWGRPSRTTRNSDRARRSHVACQPVLVGVYVFFSNTYHTFISPLPFTLTKPRGSQTKSSLISL